MAVTEEVEEDGGADEEGADQEDVSVSSVLSDDKQGVRGELVAPLRDGVGDVAWQRLTPSLCQK